MYLEHFGFTMEPFELAPNSEFLYLSKCHKKAFTYLNYALWNKDTFTMLTGDIGSGKTILLQHLLKIMPNTAEIIAIYQTQLTPYELLYSIAEQLGLVSSEEIPKPKLFQLINNYIRAATKNVVLIIDEAQSFSRETMEELRLLAGVDLLSAKTNINIILCGQPELKGLVEGGTLEQLNQRIKLRFHLTPLDFDETREYINFRINKAGQKLEIFTQDAVRRIYELSHGVPRLINVVADTALTCGYADGFYAISSKQVEEAYNELGWKTKDKSLEQTHDTRPEASNVVDLKKSGVSGDAIPPDLVASLNRIEAHLGRIADSIELLVTPDELEKRRKP